MPLLFLRTPYPVERAREAIDQISEELEALKPHAFYFEGTAAAWRNGILLLFGAIDPRAVGLELTKCLTKFDAFATYWGADRYRESGAVESGTSGGLMEKFLREHRGAPLCQVYLKFDSDNRWHAQTAAKIRSILSSGGDCETVFPFSDGEVWFCAPRDPNNPIFGRIRSLARTLPGFVYVDEIWRFRTPKSNEPECWKRFEVADDEDEDETETEDAECF